MKTTKMSLVTLQGNPGKAGMKKLLFLVVVLSLFLLQGCKPADQIKLHVTVSNDVCQSGQWVYWFSLNANEYNIEDSCYLPKGQHSFTMKKVIPDMNEEMGCWLTFTKHGPLQAFLFLSKGENVKLTINKDGITKTEGSSGTEEWYNLLHETQKSWKKIDFLTGELETTKDSLTQMHLVDSINYLKNSMDFKMRVDEFNKIKTPKMFLLQIVIPGLPQKTVDSLVKVMKQRFPDNKRVQEYPRHPKYPPSTPHSDWVKSRLLQIWTKRTGFNYNRPTFHELSAEQKEELRKNKILILRNRVDSLSVKGPNGKVKQESK